MGMVIDARLHLRHVLSAGYTLALFSSSPPHSAKLGGHGEGLSSRSTSRQPRHPRIHQNYAPGLALPMSVQLDLGWLSSFIASPCWTEDRQKPIASRNMNKLCRQVSIESPGPIIKDCVFSFDVPVPEVPPKGGRLKVVCAGACYRLQRSPSISSVSSSSSEISQEMAFPPQSPAYLGGVRDSALFPGYEVAGIVESVGEEVEDNPDDVKVGDRVVLYPYEGVPHGYAEFITVPDLRYLVKLPDCVPLSVAAMLPTGAVLAMNTVESAHQYVQDTIRQRGPTGKCKILIVGTGGLALWAMRIAAHHYSSSKDQVSITVASLKDEGFLLAKEYKKVNVVQWNEDLYEKQLIERTKDACEGPVDIVIDFGTTSRSLHRSLQCLSDGGVVFINSEVAEKLMPKFSRKADERHQKLKPVKLGSIAQLKQLVQLVANGSIEPPPHSIFPAEEACEVVKKLIQSDIKGRAILRFHSIE